VSKLIIAVGMLLAINAQAAQWTISSNTGAPGASVPINVRLTGDGQTREGDIRVTFDDARLALTTATGDIPGAGQNGASCRRLNSNTIQIVRTSNSSTLLPNTPTTLCTIPFTILSPAGRGRAFVNGSAQVCYSNTAAVTPCTVTNGVVTVTGTVLPPPSAGTDPFKYLHVLLSNAPGAPTVNQLVAFNFSSGLTRPLAGLNVESPLLATGLLERRAKGDFAAYIAQYPNTASAKLERYIVVQYRATANLNNAKAALAADPFVSAVYEPFQQQFSASSPEPTPAKSAPNQYHFDKLKIPEAWQLAGGWSLIGILDSGLRTEHPDLKSFSGAGSVGGLIVEGGNFLPVYSKDVGGWPNTADFNVDELQPEPATSVSPASAQICDLLDGVDDDLMTVASAGHGSNVAGLAGANASNTDGIEGVCRRCGIGMWRIAVAFCDTFSPAPPRVTPIIGPNTVETSLKALVNDGAQVVNLSFGDPNISPVIDYCGSNPSSDYCLALQLAFETDVIVSTASGNNRTRLQFPARALTTAGIGATDANNDFWDESPGSTTNCPDGFSDAECGSNYTTVTGEKRQEIVVPGRGTRATMYPGKDWNGSCGDSFGGGSASDGYGVCTGTSMSAPIASGIYGLLRSINPLMVAGDGNPAVEPFGVRDVVTTTTNRAQAGLGWDSQFGYGMPDVPMAARKMLGTVRTSTVRNRATPLFSLYSVKGQDYAAVATPQSAMRLARYSSAAYSTVPTSNNFIGGASIPGYGSFPVENATAATAPSPRANAYILTTEYPSALEQSRTLTPLYLLDRKRQWPVNCTPDPNAVPQTCFPDHTDYILLTSTAQVNSAVAAGYVYRGLQGYVYTTQAAFTQKLNLQCRQFADDCAVFLENQRVAFVAAGYTELFPGASTSVLGYAYATDDSDSDGLPDAMEFVIGTNVNATDSDGDGLSDVTEFPLISASTSDPCDGPNITCSAPAPLIFASGFE
jgi:serine protease